MRSAAVNIWGKCAILAGIIAGTSIAAESTETAGVFPVLTAQISELVKQAEAVPSSPVSQLQDKTAADIDALIDKTKSLVKYFYADRKLKNNGEQWCRYFELYGFINDLETVETVAKNPIRRVSLGMLTDDVLIPFCDRVNTVLARFNSSKMTGEQRIFLDEPAVADWQKELQGWAADTVSLGAILQGINQYETTAGMTDMRILAALARRMSVSKTPEYAQLGSAVYRYYGNPNLKIYISSELLNRHIPKTESEVARFRDVIQDRPVIGKRITDTITEVSFIPDPNRLRVALNVGIDLLTYSKSEAFATDLFNAGKSSVIARKEIELTAAGLQFSPSDAELLEHRLKLLQIKTGFDNVPVLERVFRNAVLNQYREKQGAARSETQRKVLSQVRRNIDKETELRFSAFNEKYRSFFKYVNETFAIAVDQQNSRTDENWLLTSWRVKSTDTLGSAFPAPNTPEGAFADMKVHESVINLFLGKLGLEGKKGKVSDFKKMIAEKFNLPALAEPAEGDDIEITFAQRNPLTVRFAENSIELTISITAMRLLANTKLASTHRNFQVIVRYKPAGSGETLERDSYISLINVRSQIVMRAIFGNIFAVNRTIPLTPKFITNDTRFGYLTVGNCRIENGWFAAALMSTSASKE